MKSGLRAIAAALLASVPAGLCAQARGAPAELVTYACREQITNPGGTEGMLVLHKTFLEDGSVQSESVELTDNGSFIRVVEPAERVMVLLNWPGGHRYRATPEPFSWSDGSVRVLLLTPSFHRWERGEIWRETFVTRRPSILTYTQDGRRLLLPGIGGLHLTTGLESLGSAHALNASIDDLLAWGQGVERLTVYHVLVQRRRYRRNSYPNDSAGRRRIVGQFEIDLAGLARRVAQVRDAAAAWNVGDFRACERQIQHPDENIVVTT